MKAKLNALLKGWLTHLFILLFTVLLFSFFRRHNLSEGIWDYFARHLANKDSLLTVLVTLLAEIFYLYLFKKLNFALFILACLFAGLLSVFAIVGLMPSRYERRIIDYLDPLLIIAVYVLAYAVIRDYLYSITRKKDIQLQQFKNELDTLKAQLNPHFLFNSLNYLYGIALKEQASQTADGIDQLSEMMRYTITGIRQNFVPLENELKFMAHYLALQQARLPVSEDIKLDIQLPTQTPPLQIAPLLLLPFMENAFKYGINMDGPCFVTIKITVVNNTLIMDIHNSITDKPIEITGNNTGIKNTIKRLNLLYPGNYKLDQAGTATQYQTTLQLQLKN